MIDLHIHTTASDGFYGPKTLLDKCKQASLKAVAITDHDSVDSVDEALSYGAKIGLDVVPSIELSSDLNGRDVHILGYYIDHRDRSFLSHLKLLRRTRRDRAIKMIKALNKRGVDVSLEDLSKVVTNESSWGRAHISRVMLAKGYVSSIQEAFDRYIGRNAPCYVERYIYSPAEVIEMVLNIGGLPVLAHPAITKVDKDLPDFVDVGLAGIEIYHSEHTKADVGKYRRVADELGILKTGGSDYHGETKNFSLGSIEVPDELYFELKEEWQQRQRFSGRA
ncbi:MAG: PHP domain-containing protein [Actinomycetota bacterium]|nr:PHP domain-containing protein [Actinomycetota bacterium]